MRTVSPKLKLESHSTSTSIAGVKNAWNSVSNPPLAFTSWCLIQLKDNVTFLWRLSSGLFNVVILSNRKCNV